MPVHKGDLDIESYLHEHYQIGSDQFQQAKRLNRQNRLGLWTNLQQLGVLNEEQALQAQADLFGMRIVDLKHHPVDPEIQSLIPENLLRQFKLVPLSKSGTILTVATSSLLDAHALSDLQKSSKHFIQLVLAYPKEIAQRLNETPQTTQNIDDMLEGKAEQLVTSSESDAGATSDPHGPVGQALNYIIQQAVSQGASDIHFEPFSKTYRIRYRVDGVLREVKTFDKVFIAPFSTAVKVMAGADIAETRLPQDGAISSVFAGRQIEFRVATYPTKFGEKIVLRILDSQKDFIHLDSLHLPTSEIDKLKALAEQPNGLILCAGPTGSGKSTTLYALLKHINQPAVNILTIEDPIEYRLPGVTQAQVNNTKGFTFSKGLRAMLRLDPDVILVGEMRDLETSETGLQAALTGHLVLSTVHSNSATQTINRLFDLGVESFVVGSALNGVISQRLARKICEACKESYSPSAKELNFWGSSLTPKELWKGRGCHKCHQTGYSGRVPIVEILTVSNPMRAAIASRAHSGAIYQMALENGMRTMQQDALDKVARGLSTLEEVTRLIGVPLTNPKTAAA